MPELQGTPRRYYQIDKSQGGLKRKAKDGTDINTRALAGQLLDFYFKDDEYDGEVSRRFYIVMADVDEETGEQVECIVQTQSSVFISGFLNKIASAPGPGNLAKQEYISLGSFKPDDAKYIVCMMDYVSGPSSNKIYGLYTGDELKSWRDHDGKPTAVDLKMQELRLMAAAVRWRKQHLAVDPEIKYLSTQGQLKESYGDSHYTAPQGGEPAQPTASKPEPQATQQEPHGVELKDFIENMVTLAPDQLKQADPSKVEPVMRAKAEEYLRHYNKIVDQLTGSALPHTEVELLKKGQYGKGSWPQFVDKAYEMLMRHGVIAEPADTKLPGEEQEAPAYEDDLPF